MKFQDWRRMSEKKKILPELRFPEFEKDGEWEETSLDKISPSIFDGTHQTPKYTDDGVPFFSVENIVSGNKNKFISREDYLYETRNNKPEFGDVLITRIGSIGIPKVVDWDYEFSIYVTLATIKKSNKFDSHYLGSYIQSNRFQKEILRRSLLKAAPQKINMNELRECEVLLPPKYQEQKKIAACLSSLDTLIDAHSNKLDVFKDHKKGLLQNLFPQKGQKVPNYRFPEFKKDKEWRERKLGDKQISSLVNNKIDSDELTLKNYISTDNMLAEYSGITEASKLPKTNRVTEYIEGDILVSNIRPYLKKVWKSDRKGGASNDVLVFRSGSEITIDFLEATLKNDAFIKYVMRSAKGLKMPRGDKSSMLKYPIRVPMPEEQQKVASCISTVDNLIAAQAKKVEQLRIHKRGLIQGLFPQIH